MWEVDQVYFANLKESSQRSRNSLSILQECIFWQRMYALVVTDIIEVIKFHFIEFNSKNQTILGPKNLNDLHFITLLLLFFNKFPSWTSRLASQKKKKKFATLQFCQLQDPNYDLSSHRYVHVRVCVYIFSSFVSKFPQLLAGSLTVNCALVIEVLIQSLITQVLLCEGSSLSSYSQ